MHKRARRLFLSAGLPEDALSDCARVTLTGQSAALVEGQHGVIELTDKRIRLKTGQGVLTVAGKNLRLAELSVDAALISGEPVDRIAYGRAAEGTDGADR